MPAPDIIYDELTRLVCCVCNSRSKPLRLGEWATFVHERSTAPCLGPCWVEVSRDGGRTWEAKA